MSTIIVPVHRPPNWAPAFDELRVGEVGVRALDATQWAAARGRAVTGIDVAVDPRVPVAAAPQTVGAFCFLNLLGTGVPGSEPLVAFTVRLAGGDATIIPVRQPIRAGLPDGLLPAGYGPVNTTAPTLTTAANVAGHRALSVLGGFAVQADPTMPDLYNFVGISLGAAPSGTPVPYATAGQTVSEPSWSWTPGDSVFVGPAGTLTAVPPTTGVSHQVAIATSATTLLLVPLQPILLS